MWWRDVCAISRALMAKTNTTGDDVAAIAVSALGADLVPLDAQGRALRPAILYGIDTRSIEEIADLNAMFGADDMARLAGQHLTSQAIGPKILWVRPGRRRRTGPARGQVYQEYYRIYRDLYPHTREDMYALARLGAAKA